MAWNDKGRTLSLPEMKGLLRDGCAMLGKCAMNSSPATVLAKTPVELRFDDPPLRNRPAHQKRALVYQVTNLLFQANIFVHPTDFPVDYFKTNADVALTAAADFLADIQEYPHNA